MSGHPALAGRKVRAPGTLIAPNGSGLPLKTAITESATETIKGETPRFGGGSPGDRKIR